jgi:hypothetical protein
VTLVGVVLLYLRLPFAARQFWAEDGREFFGDAIRFGPIRSLGHSEAGYYLSVSRLGGVFASFVPIRAAALTMWVWTAVVVAWLVATVTVSSRSWLRTWPARIMVALSIVLLPVSGQESIANAANLQFPMLFASLVVLISQPRSRVERANGCAMLVATGLTTPLAAALVPFAVWRLVRARTVRPDPYVIGWVVGVVVQWLAIALTRPSRPPHNGDNLSTIMRRLEASAFRQNLTPSDVSQHPGPWVAVVFAVVVMVIAALTWKRDEGERALLLVAVPTFGVALLTVLALNSGASYRYMVITGLCLVWTAMAGAEAAAEIVPRSWPIPTAAVTAAVAALLLVPIVTRWTPSAVRRSGPTWADSLDDAQQTCRDHPLGSVHVRIAPLNPEKPDQWSVVIPCRDLG